MPSIWDFLSRLGFTNMNIRAILTPSLLLFLVTPASALAAVGRAVYEAHCVRCHGDDGRGDGPASTMQRPLPRDFTSGRYKFRSTPLNTLPLTADVAHVIAKGIRRTSMPPYEGKLSPEEIDAAARYVMGFSAKSGVPDGAASAVARPDMPQTEATPEMLAKGRQLFTKHSCDTCHGSDGRGLGPLAGGLVDPHGSWTAPADLTDPMAYGGGPEASDVYMRLRTGIALSPMTDYSQTLDEASARAIAYYVRSLQVAPEARRPVAREAWNAALPSRTRGEYMVRAMSCALCHNFYDATGKYDPDMYLAGGVAIRIPGLGTFPTRNLTSHPKYGLGNWTEDQISTAVTTGRAPTRQLEAFAMPWVFFSHLTSGDARDIAAYVKTLPAIANDVPLRRFDPFWKRLWHRVCQLLGLEKGRLEYPPFNAGRER